VTIGLNIKGHTVIIDEEDLPLLKPYSWRVEPGRHYVRSFVAKTKRSPQKHISLHRLILGLHDVGVPHVDHKNRNPLDNRKCNLRTCTVGQNNFNSRGLGKKKDTGYRGVYYHTDKRYPLNVYIVARIGFQKKNIHLGVFESEIEAAKAYNNAAMKLHGEFAVLNQI
jgi:hypothetical protein